MNLICIKGGRVVDPSQNLDSQADLWIEDDKILSVGLPVDRAPDHVIDARGLLVLPGLVDMHVHLREPGDENDETIESGTRAALESGVTSLAVMPDTEPAIDNQSSAEFIALQAKRAGAVNVFPVGALTKGLRGEELAEMGGLVEGGSVAFSDSDVPIANPEILRRGLEYANMLGKTVLSRPEAIELTRGGIMNEGFVSVSLGMAGMPAAAERIQVDRDINLAKWTGSRLHLQCLSSEGSVASVRRAKADGAQVTAETSPHYFTLTEDELRSFDSVYKTNPPLRTARDVEGIIEGLVDGTIEVIASDHSPYANELKIRELDVAPFGAIGLETLLPVSIQALIEPGLLSWTQLVEKLATNPARILGVNRGTLKSGRPADVLVLDPNEEWTIDASLFRSRARNCPFDGWKVRGRVRAVLVDGEVRFSRAPAFPSTVPAASK